MPIYRDRRLFAGWNSLVGVVSTRVIARREPDHPPMLLSSGNRERANPYEALGRQELVAWSRPATVRRASQTWG